MQSQNKFFEDLARVASGAAGALSGLRAEFEALARQQMERLMGEMNLVSRDEFDAVRAMAAKARAEQEALEKRVAELEAALKKRPAATKTPAGQPRRKRTAAAAAKTATKAPRKGPKKD